MATIEIHHITKDYGNHKGVFDVTFSVRQGEILGFLGPNGAGKTTTIRQLMGFIRPDQGSVQINGLDCFIHADQIQKNLGYLPGEIAFMDDMTGTEFLQFMEGMKEISGKSRRKELTEFFELDARSKIKKMSKGMKQKIGLVCAFMQDADILILDEPTSGLDPLMQNKFVELIMAEKKRGKTILMSSHIFEEIERTCDRAAIIKDGKLIAVESMDKIRGSRQKRYHLRFATEQEANSFQKDLLLALSQVKKDPKNSPAIHLSGTNVDILYFSDIDLLFKTAAHYTLADVSAESGSLEELFLQFYHRDPLTEISGPEKEINS